MKVFYSNFIHQEAGMKRCSTEEDVLWKARSTPWHDILKDFDQKNWSYAQSSYFDEQFG